MAALLQDALVLLRQLLLVLPALALELRQVPELGLAGRHAVHGARLARLGPRDPLVLALVDLVVFVVALRGVAVAALVVVGPAVVAVVAAAAAVLVLGGSGVVVIVVVLLEALDRKSVV